jgi:GNAT superfamily N-acetyltransferase
MSNDSPSFPVAVTVATPHSCGHHAQHSPPPTSAAFTIARLTDPLLPLLEDVEAASYPESYREGVSGYAKRLHATPACPSFVCLQCTGSNSGCTDVAALVAAGDVTHLRAIGYAITCRMPRRTASLLVRDAPEDNSEVKRPSQGCRHTGSDIDDDDTEEEKEGDRGVADNHAVRLLTEAADHLPSPSLVVSHSAQRHLDTFYVHDVAVHPDFRGLGVAGALWRQMEQARVSLQLKRMSLVAVFGASAYWSRFGFREVAREALPADTVRVLDDYGDHAVFMERED